MSELPAGYINQRPIRVKGFGHGVTVFQYLCHRIPSQSELYWREALATGAISRRGIALLEQDILNAGDELVHTYIENAEPAVPTDFEIVYDDDVMMVINKPAGLPVHPCGRYHHHTLTALLNVKWPHLNLRPVHRLDSATSGLLILAKSREAAKNLSAQFEAHTVDKTYLARVHGVPEWTHLTCDARISVHKGENGRRYVDHDGQTATTEFVRLDGNLIQAKPISGRTNQIRVHLEHLGFPIVGDNIYGSDSTGKLQLHAWKIVFANELSVIVDPAW